VYLRLLLFDLLGIVLAEVPDAHVVGVFDFCGGFGLADGHEFDGVGDVELGPGLLYLGEDGCDLGTDHCLLLHNTIMQQGGYA